MLALARFFFFFNHKWIILVVGYSIFSFFQICDELESYSSMKLAYKYLQLDDGHEVTWKSEIHHHHCKK